MTHIVYMAVNLLNGKKYIGITRSTLEERRRRHFGDARRGLRTKFARICQAFENQTIVKASVCSVLNGRLKTAAGRQFEYYEGM